MIEMNVIVMNIVFRHLLFVLKKNLEYFVQFNVIIFYQVGMILTPS